MVTVEQILDLLADELINAPEVDLSMVRGNQKTIRNGLIQLGRDNSEKLILFEKDVKANEQDFTDDNIEGNSLTSIVENFAEGLDISQCEFDIVFDSSGETPIISSIILNANNNYIPMTNIFYNGETGNPINLSQFMNLQELTQDIDVGLAEEYLDTTIFELLPEMTLRQQRIINFFNEFQNLVGHEPQFNPGMDGIIDVDENGVYTNNEYYSENHDISAAQDTPDEGIQEEDSFITRLEQDANSNNEQYTLQGLRSTLNNYLQDIDQELPPLQDERPIYRNQSDGYLKFRNLNQGIIIRNTENEFLKGLDPDNPTWLDTGFSITMWVKFLDKSSQGTLFNYGNPFRENQNEAFGFSLETYVLKRDDAVGVEGYGAGTYNTWGEIFQDGNQLDLTYDNAVPNEGFFSEDNAERFIRLVVKDNQKLRGSHIGMSFLDRREGLPEFNRSDEFTVGDNPPYDHTFGLMTNTRVPIDYSEWYFICATFNPNIQEDLSFTDNNVYDVYKNNSDFWRGNLFPGGEYTHHSTYGAQSKVEIISKTDLLRARGFKVD